MTKTYDTLRFDPYEVLRLKRDATQEEIKAAYRQRSKETHPDVSQEKTGEFHRVAKAYEVLKNAKLREVYDRTGTAFEDEEVYRQAVQAEFAGVIDMIIDQMADLDSADLLESARSVVAHGREACRVKLSKVDADIAKLKRKQGKVVRGAADGTNVFELVLGKRIAKLEEERRSLSRTLQITSEILTDMKDYQSNRAPGELNTYSDPENPFARYTSTDPFRGGFSRGGFTGKEPWK